MAPHYATSGAIWYVGGTNRLLGLAEWYRWLVVVILVSTHLPTTVQAQFSPQCEEIKIPMCLTMPYNLTRLPNLLHHSTQENAKLAVEQFELLRWTKCSDQLEFFLCSMYAPICTLGFLTEAIPPCRSVCEAARQGCEPLLDRFNIPWPSNLECETLPVYDRGVCITPQAIISSEVTPRPAQTQASCVCRKPRRLRKKLYKNGGFHYAVRGRVLSVETFGELTLTRLLVLQVVMPGRVLLQPGRDALLWTNRSCACPPLHVDGDYLILGWEDFENSRLLYLEGSIAVTYRRRYIKKMQKWDGKVETSDSQVQTSPPPAGQLDNKMNRRNRNLQSRNDRIRGNRRRTKRWRRKHQNMRNQQILSSRVLKRRRSRKKKPHHKEQLQEQEE